MIKPSALGRRVRKRVRTKTVYGTLTVRLERTSTLRGDPAAHTYVTVSPTCTPDCCATTTVALLSRKAIDETNRHDSFIVTLGTKSSSDVLVKQYCGWKYRLTHALPLDQVSLR
jgi:hypothetical protein